MAFLIDEQKFVDDNAFKFENRLNSQVTRFLDKSPVFVTYYHVDSDETTTDGGFKDVNALWGKDSPIKYKKIENLPLYGFDSVQLNLQDTDQGLDTEYSGDAILLPNTVKPLQNDFFTVNHVKGVFLFRVTQVDYDTIRPDNFYKITYRIESLENEVLEDINNQVNEKFTCILQNVGSTNNCIIEESYFEQLQKVNALYSDMVETYKAIFYSGRYNCFLGETAVGMKIYDPLQAVFMNKHKLLTRDDSYQTVLLSEMFTDPKRKIKYERSIYRFFERRDLKTISNFKYYLYPGTNKKDSAFYYWQEDSILYVEVPEKAVFDQKAPNELLPNRIVANFKMNGPEISPYVDLMQRFVRGEDITIYDIPLELNEELLKLDANEEVFFFTPILLYIIKTVTNDFLQQKKKETL